MTKKETGGSIRGIYITVGLEKPLIPTISIISHKFSKNTLKINKIK